MNVLEKAEKALESLKNLNKTSKNHELQATAGTLGRCLGALGSRQNYTRHYANLLHSAIPTLLALASHESAEIRLVGDEALNRAVAGGFAFHSHKSNIILQNQIDHTKSARWIRAALSRICLGDCWLRPGVGKIRMQAQTLFPKLTHIVCQTSDVQLVVEALESNLPRILSALSEYCTDEEIIDLTKALLQHADSKEPAIRRGVASCVANLCAHRHPILTYLIEKVFEKLWPHTAESSTVLGWFNVLKSVFQLNKISDLDQEDIFTPTQYLELYHLCLYYLEQSTVEHNIQNGVMECLTVLISQAKGDYKRVLLSKNPLLVNLDTRRGKGHMRHISSTSAITSVEWRPQVLSEDNDSMSEANPLSQLQTPRSSIDDLTIQTPESPNSESELGEVDPTRINSEFSEQLQAKLLKDMVEYYDEHPSDIASAGYKINIGTSSDDDIPLKFCARLLASKFLLTGNKGGLIPDGSVRVSVKSSALNCLCEILLLYPQAITIYLDKDADDKYHNLSGSSEADSNQDNMNEFILERNVCYQDSLTESLAQDIFNKSIDSHLTLSKKEVKSSSSQKDIHSNIFDSKILVNSGISADSTNPNMSSSNFTSNSNMTGSNQTTGYPMSSSGDIITSSIDLDMRFDHFADSIQETKKQLKRTDDIEIEKELIEEKIEKESIEENIEDDTEYESQHMCDVFSLLECHSDPQIRGVVRLAIGNYVCSALDISHGDYTRWRNIVVLPKDVSDCIALDHLVGVMLKGLSDASHSCVNHTLQSLSKIISPLCLSSQRELLCDIFNALCTDLSIYYSCKMNLCALYRDVDYLRLSMLLPDYLSRSRIIMDKLFHFLSDQDHKVRAAAADAIANITPHIYPDRRGNASHTFLQIALQQTQNFNFDKKQLSLELVKDIYFYRDLPEQMKGGGGDEVGSFGGNLREVLSELVSRIMEANCKYYQQGLLETLHVVCKKYSPWQYKDSYYSLGILEYCIESLDSCGLSAQSRTIIMDITSMLYPVEIHYQMRNKTSNRDIFERDTETKRWQHLDDRMATLSEKNQLIILRSLNVVVHLLEEVSPAQVTKTVLPGSPVRKNTSGDTAKKPNQSDGADQGSLRKKPPMIVGNLRANFVGNFYSEPFYMKLYDNLRATYSNHRINLDPKSSIFYEYLTSILEALAVQLELSTEKEYGFVSEELLYYLKVIMPWRPDKTVFCITQLLKCLFGTNMINQYNDFMSISEKHKSENEKTFYDAILEMNKIKMAAEKEDSRRSSVNSNLSYKISLKNPSLVQEKDMLVNIDNFNKNRSDRKWSTNKKELERYIRLFEPVVIQSLKSYTIQNDGPLQCEVLSLLNQLLTLRVNYCMLDSDQIFIGFLFKQLDLVEQHEIPNCSEVVKNIMLFLVQLSSPKHHTKQIVEVPKLIQLCDGLLAAGEVSICAYALQPLCALVFHGVTSQGGSAVTSQLRAAREVLLSMLHKCLSRTYKVLNLTSCILSLSQENPENYYRFSELTADHILSTLSQKSIQLEERDCISAVEKLIDCVCTDVLVEQKRFELALKILFMAPPEQDSTPFNQKLRYLATVMILLRKYLVLIPESETLLTINYLKSTHISPHSIFFNVKTEIDPLNVQNVNENCANLSPDVILVRFLLRVLTYVILEIDRCHEVECTNFDVKDVEGKGGRHRLLYCICVNMMCHIKNMLHFTPDCPYPVTSKSAQTLLQNEQSSLNTGLYHPSENIPLELMSRVCMRNAFRAPAIAMHITHLLLRLKFLEHKQWPKLIRHLPVGDSTECGNMLQIGCFMAYCEYFVDTGLVEAVHLSWLLVNRVQFIITYSQTEIVQKLLSLVQENASASGLLLQAIAARCQHSLKDEFALNTYKVLRDCHKSQSGALVFFVCRIIGKLEPTLASRFANLAIERCILLKELSTDGLNINEQLSKEDVQVALELLQRDKVHNRYSKLVQHLNELASSVFDLSPLDVSQERSVNPHSVAATPVLDKWRLELVTHRCCQTTTPPRHRIEKQHDLALLLANLSKDGMETVMACPEFDRTILSSCFKISSENYLKDLLNVVSVYETKEIERERMIQQMNSAKEKEDSSTVEASKVNLPIFKRTDSKESKSQFFIPIKENAQFGNLQISDDENVIEPPPLTDLYLTSVSTFDRSLADIIKLFPKQSRPLSQSENFNLAIEQTMDKYTKRCHEFFQDKLFYQEYLNLHSILTGYLHSLQSITSVFDDIDCDAIDKIQHSILPNSLAKNIAIFSVMSLQYVIFLIKNKKIVESPIQTEVSFRVTTVVTEKVFIDNVLRLTLENVSLALSFDCIWSELNCDSNVNRTQSAINCLFGIVKYFVKDTKPLILKQFIQNEEIPSESAVTCEKLVTLVQYWEVHFYGRGLKAERNILGLWQKRCIERLLISLARLHAVSNAALIPPLAWSAVELSHKDDKLLRVDLPLQALQDLDLLEPFLFRVNLIGWSSKKQFEEIWVALLNALQGNGPHAGVRGITQLLISTLPASNRTKLVHCPREQHQISSGMQLLRNVLIGTEAYKSQFTNVNLERVPFLQDDDFDGYHYGQFNTDYLKLASEITTDAPYQVKQQLKRVRKCKDVDVNSCLQLLMDVATQMLEPQAPTGLAARAALLACITSVSDVARGRPQWYWQSQRLISCSERAHLAHFPLLLLGLTSCKAVLSLKSVQGLTPVHEKLLKSLSSSYAPLRQAALHGCLLQLKTDPTTDLTTNRATSPAGHLLHQLNSQYHCNNKRISLYEQSLHWAVLFTLVEQGNTDLMNIAVDFLLNNPRHYCADLVVKGITSVIRQQILPKDLKNSIMEKLLDNMSSYSEDHYVEVLMVHLFSANNKLLSPKLSPSTSNMDPDVLMNSMERIVLLYKVLRQCQYKRNMDVIMKSIEYFLRESLPPAAILSRVVMEFLQNCSEAEKKMADVLGDRERWVACAKRTAPGVFEVFETAVAQNQLSVLSGWIFEALCHLLNQKISQNLLAYCVTFLLVSASPNKIIRKLIPICYEMISKGFVPDYEESIFKDYLCKDFSISFGDRRLLCIVAMHSGFSDSQLERLKELCESHDCLNDLYRCLTLK